MGLGRIPEAFIQDVLSRIDIVDIVSSRVQLKKSGASYTACCPFHNEKTPSFSVSQTKQFYHCFGCGAHGDAIAFITQHDGLNFIEALTQLATSVGLKVPQDPKQVERDKELKPLYLLMSEALEFYQEQLVNHPQGKVAIEYLKKRGITGKMAKLFGIGFAPSGWSNLLDKLGREPETLVQLEKVGLLVKGDKGQFYDRFRNRVMIPIRDRKGQVIGFGGRVLDDSLPKYLNSPETPLFHKGHCLFGLHEALKKPFQLESVILVEGYMDVIALEQYGIYGALATLGTAVTEYHLKLLFKYCKNVYFCFDGDKAGRSAALKTQQVLLPFLEDGIEVKFVFLPEGSDPDSYLHKQGKEAFEGLLSRGLPFSEYFFRVLKAQVNPDTIDGKAHFAKVAKPLLAQLPKGLFRELMYNKLSEIVQLERKPFFRSYQKGVNHFATQNKKNVKPSGVMPPARLAALLLIREPLLVTTIEDIQSLKFLKLRDVSLLVTIVELLNKDPQMSQAELLKALAEVDPAWQNLEVNNSLFDLIPKGGVKQEFLGALQRLMELSRREMSKILLEKAKNGELSEVEKLQLKNLLN